VKLATLCYLRKAAMTLMLYRNRKKNDTHQGKWNGLGGKLEAGETPEECAIREVKEESGFISTHIILKGMITFPMFDGVDDWYVFVFEIDEFHGEMIDSPEGELAWIENTKLLDLNLWEGDKTFLPWLWEDKFFSARFTYLERELESWSVNFY
jgi:8-oxo-dGTP diphosphatase